MSEKSSHSNLKRKKTQYRIVLMNEDTYEEVLRFRLNRLSVYIAASSLFVLLVGLTTALIIFTPLKYYLPGVGFGNARAVREYRHLRLRTDSMEKALYYNNKYVEDLQKVLKGKASTLDTSLLNLPGAEDVEE